jgi:OFA family oxalate/formate antiporter-like MFS transporter
MKNRWFQLVASLIAMIMIANLQYAWTLFVKPLQAGTGWKLSDIQWAFTLFILFQTWVQPAQGWFIDRLGPRIFTTAAGILCGVGWASMGYATSLPMLYTLYILAGIGAAFVYGGCIGSALKWFDKGRGLASGIMAAGFGGGAALFMPFISSTIASSGYREAFLYTGVFQGAVILIVAQFLCHPASKPEAAAKPASSAAIGTRNFTTLEMLRTPQFYFLYIAFVSMATGGLLVTANAGPMAQSWGIPLAALTFATQMNAVANGASRIFWGWASDKIGRERAMVIAFIANAVCLLSVLTLGRQSGTLFTITLVLTFFTWGEVFSLFPSITGDYFGTKSATANYGVMYSAKGVAAIIGGGVGAMLFEYFGTWAACFYGSAALALFGALVLFGLRMSRQAQSAPLAVAVGAK